MMTANDYVTASFDELFRQSPDTMATYLRQAKDEIDSVFGEGYAEKNPNLVAAFIQGAASDMGNATLAKVLGHALQEISSAVNGVASSLERD